MGFPRARILEWVVISYVYCAVYKFWFLVIWLLHNTHYKCITFFFSQRKSLHKLFYCHKKMQILFLRLFKNINWGYSVSAIKTIVSASEIITSSFPLDHQCDWLYWQVFSGSINIFFLGKSLLNWNTILSHFQFGLNTNLLQSFVFLNWCIIQFSFSLILLFCHEDCTGLETYVRLNIYLDT